MTPQFADYIREEVPKAIRCAPDELIKRLPEYRENLEKRVEADLRARSAEATKRLNDELNAFLTSTRTAVGELIKNGNDPAAVGGDRQGAGGRVPQVPQGAGRGGHADPGQAGRDAEGADARREAHRPARREQGPHPSEQKARHAVAMLMHRIDAAKEAHGPITLPKLDPEAAREMLNMSPEEAKSKASEAAEKVKNAVTEQVGKAQEGAAKAGEALKSGAGMCTPLAHRARSRDPARWGLFAPWADKNIAVQSRG